MAKIRRICYLALMAEKSCRVTVSDMNGTAHTVQITASTLYEAVARGLAAIRGNEWVAGIAQGLNVVKVSVASVPVEHQVKMQDFTNWLERKGGSPREVADRERVRSILGCDRSFLSARELRKTQNVTLDVYNVSLSPQH